MNRTPGVRLAIGRRMGLKCLAAALVGSMQEVAIAQGASASVATQSTGARFTTLAKNVVVK